MDGDSVTSVCWNERVRLKLQPIQESCAVINKPRTIFLMQLWFYQGGLVAVGTHKGYVQIWDAAGGRKLTTLEGHSARVGQSRLNYETSPANNFKRKF